MAANQLAYLTRAPPTIKSESPLKAVPRAAVKNAWQILSHEDAVQRIDPDHWSVVCVRRPDKRARVLRRGIHWRCDMDRTQDQGPLRCSHVLAVRYYEGLDTSPGVTRPAVNQARRNQALEAQTWREQPQQVPLLLSRLLQAAIPMLQPPESVSLRGRPFLPLYASLYQSIIRATFRYSLSVAEGFMETPEHRKHNPYPPVSVASMSRFHSDPKTTPLLAQLLALSTWPAKSYDCIHTNDAALTHYYFKLDPGQGHVDASRPARRTWAQVLWSHHYNLIVATRIQTGYFGESPVGCPVTEGATLMLDILPDPTNVATCRAHAGAGSAALRRQFRKELFSTTPTGQRNELLCRAIGHNLTRLIYLGLEKRIDVRFENGAQLLPPLKEAPKGEPVPES